MTPTAGFTELTYAALLVVCTVGGVQALFDVAGCARTWGRISKTI